MKSRRSLALLAALTLAAAGVSGCGTVGKINPFHKNSNKNKILASKGERIPLLAYNQTLPFHQEMLRGITVNVSYTRSYADARRGGLLPHRVTSSLGYSYRKLKLRAGLVWRDNTDDGSATTDYGRFRRHDAKLDFGGEYAIHRYVSLFFQGRNIFNGGQMWMQTPTGNVQGQGAAVRVYENYGTNWNFGVKGTF